MIIVKLMGGLGNQMFQYALGRHLALKNNDELRLDLTFLLDRTPRPDFVFRDYALDLFPIQAQILGPEERQRIVGIPANHHRFQRIPLAAHFLHALTRWRSGQDIAMVQEQDLTFHPEVLTRKGSLYLDGYWQSPRYFESVESEIRKDFSFRPAAFDAPIQALATEVQEVNSICINVRRGDFVALATATKFHGVYGADYIQRAVAIMAARVPHPHFYVFSDDLPWCRENIRLDHPTTVVGHELAGPGFSAYLYLMSRCQHFIIPNSTFAWWAAWLHPGSDKTVIAPAKWLADPQNKVDILPPAWIKL
jgi:hypothetical protein